MDRCDIESPLNPGVVAVVIVIVGSFDAWGSVQHGREEDGGEGCGGGCRLQQFAESHDSGPFRIFVHTGGEENTIGQTGGAVKR